ncbi:MAG TPA: HAMP domain-containing sensor histidine kinase [Steroidobacteraceae bacterium]|jgi:signal transduction histidine kinase
MGNNSIRIGDIADHMSARREPILVAWRRAIQRDPTVTSGDALPRHQLYDHIPTMLITFEQQLRRANAGSDGSAEAAAQKPAAAHGLQRWQQGYDLREVTRELCKLNECVVQELDAFHAEHPQVSGETFADARRCWAAICSTAIEESVSQYFLLQQQEAAGHVADLEAALEQIRQLEQQRADLWRQAAHDLRGNLGVVANATVGLAHTGLQESSRDQFVRILMRNVASLHHLLDDITSLARLQAGDEQRKIEFLDVASIMVQLCEGIRPLAQQRHLFLRTEGPTGFATEGDATKVRRIAQNLILNAVKFTQLGGVTVTWGDSGHDDPKRWLLTVTDTGPGLQTDSGAPISSALKSLQEAPAKTTDQVQAQDASAKTQSTGEGIGLSIVKRLCELLNATVEVQSSEGAGTTFRILFPRSYSS